MNAAMRVPTPSMISSPPTNWIAPAHQDGHAPKSAVCPLYGATGQANNVEVPWQKNRKPTTTRKTEMAHGDALSSQVSITYECTIAPICATRAWVQLPRFIHSSRCGDSVPTVVPSPWPV